MILTDENGKKYKAIQGNITVSWEDDFLVIRPVEKKPKFVKLGIVHDREYFYKFIPYHDGGRSKNISWQTLARTIANFMAEANWATLNHYYEKDDKSVLVLWEKKPSFSVCEWGYGREFQSIIIDYVTENAYSECIIEIERIE